MAKQKSILKIQTKVDNKTRQAIIRALLVDYKNSDWAVSTRVMKSLMKEHPSSDFWFFVAKRRRFRSLLSLSADKPFIFRCWLDYTKQYLLKGKVNPEIKLEQEKVDDDIIVPQKQLTLLEFIDS